MYHMLYGVLIATVNACEINATMAQPTALAS